jgi:hypothetical protein
MTRDHDVEESYYLHTRRAADQLRRAKQTRGGHKKKHYTKFKFIWGYRKKRDDLPDWKSKAKDEENENNLLFNNQDQDEHTLEQEY